MTELITLELWEESRKTSRAQQIRQNIKVFCEQGGTANKIALEL